MSRGLLQVRGRGLQPLPGPGGQGRGGGGHGGEHRDDAAQAPHPDHAGGPASQHWPPLRHVSPVQRALLPGGQRLEHHGRPRQGQLRGRVEPRPRQGGQ